ncbi:MAG: TetR/AcrR family transcriptional regulator [Firmicutes bacterium]|jgi:AcrR family transcriptional regulator|nr:TetR/AcrR family transcriptional regulator [Bacillota bacterium]
MLKKTAFFKKRVSKKEIQKRRMMSYFIEAVHKIIEEEGLEFITIRKVSDIAGYNSATLYNYFKDLDHLIFFASLKYLKDYVLNLPKWIKGYKNSVDKYLRIWKCFCYYSFNKPNIYNIIFFSKYSHSLKDAIKDYYTVFPEELMEEQSQELLPMLLKHNIYERNFIILEECASEGYINKEDIDKINDMTLLLYQGMLTRLLNCSVDYSIDQTVSLALEYIFQIIKSFAKKDIPKDLYLFDSKETP